MRVLALKQDYAEMQQQNQELLELRNERHFEVMIDLEQENKKLKQENRILLRMNLMLVHTCQLGWF